MSAQRLDALNRFFLENDTMEIIKLEEKLDFIKRRSVALKCYHERFPKWPETPSQLEHIQAFIDLLDDLRKSGGNPNDIAEIKCDLETQLIKDDHGEPEVQHRRYLAYRIQRAVDATISGLRAQIVEFKDDKAEVEKDLINSGNIMPTVGKE